MLHLAKLSLSSSILASYKDPLQLKKAVEAEVSGLHYSDYLLNFIRTMLESDPTQRPPIENIMSRSLTVNAALFRDKCDLQE